MIRTSLLATLLAASLAPVAHSATSAARAAEARLPAAQSTPVSSVSLPNTQKLKFRGQVVNETSKFITVRSSDPDHLNELRTFTFSPELQPKMQSILDAGGYQSGDRVTVTFFAGSTVALKISGKPSKPA
jgi:hypothetical protein